MIEKNYLVAEMYADIDMFSKDKKDTPRNCCFAKICKTYDEAIEFNEKCADKLSSDKFHSGTIIPLTQTFVLSQSEIDLVKKLSDRICPDDFDKDEFEELKQFRKDIHTWNYEKDYCKVKGYDFDESYFD